MEWSSSRFSGSAPFDLARGRCLAAQARLAQAPERQFQPYLPALTDILNAAFGEIERMMENMGFPELMVHRAQHQRVLGALQGAETHAAHGRACGARALVALLPHWFVFYWVRMGTTLVAATRLAASGMLDASAARRPGPSLLRAPGP